MAASKIPIVTGVGHETDFTIADFVADLRAPTPSAAAELISPNRTDLLADVNGLRRALARTFADQLRENRWDLQRVRTALQIASPRAQLANARQQVDDLQRRAAAALRHGLRLRRSVLAGLEGTLRAVGPAAVLARGYAVVRDDAGKVVRSVSQLGVEDPIRVRLADGTFSGRVERIDPGQGASEEAEEASGGAGPEV